MNSSSSSSSYPPLDAWSTLLRNRTDPSADQQQSQPQPRVDGGQTGSRPSNETTQGSGYRIPSVGRSAEGPTSGSVSSFMGPSSVLGSQQKSEASESAPVGRYSIPSATGGSQQRQSSPPQRRPQYEQPNQQQPVSMSPDYARKSSPTRAASSQQQYQVRQASPQRSSPPNSQGQQQPMSTVENPVHNVLWQGAVEKLGRNMQSHKRVVVVADGCIYVCLEAGGVTRTIELQNVQSIRLAPPHVAQCGISNEADLVLSMPTAEQRLGFVNAVQQGKRAVSERSGLGSGEVEVASVSSVSAPYQRSPSREASHQESPIQQQVRQQNGSEVNSMGRPLRDSPPQQYPQQLQNPQRAPWQLPPSIAERHNHSTGSLGAAGDHSGSERQGGSFDDRHDFRRKQLEDLKSVVDSDTPFTAPSALYALQSQVEAQQMVIEQLQKKANDDHVVEELRKDLEHSRSLVTDLQTALRAQEGVFQEMLRAQEALRVAEDVKSNLEKQVNLLKEEKKSWKATLEAKDKELAEMHDRLKLNDIEHEDELAQIRKAFAEYDANVATYLEGLRSGAHILPGASSTATFGLMGTPAAQQQAAPQQQSSHAHGTPQPQKQSGYPTPPAQGGAGAGDDAGHLGFESNSDSDGLQSSLLQRLNSYANRKYNLPYGHPAPKGVPLNRSPHRTSETPGRIRDRSIL